MAAFGYLYNNRSAAMMHALPLRREALFTTQYLAGLSCLLLPHLAVALVTAAAELAFLPMELSLIHISSVWTTLMYRPPQSMA